jgi:hypothetical protein
MSMTNVEILVPSDSASKVKAALGSLPSVSFSTKPTRRGGSRLLVAPLGDLDSAAGRRNVELMLADLLLPGDASVVFVQLKSEGPRTGAGLQALAHWAHRFKQEPYVADPAAIRRLALARKSGAERELIASASVEDGKLIVWSCEPKRYEVLVSELPVLARLNEVELLGFEVSTSGSRIHWPDGDIDINLDTIREHADPQVRKQHEIERRKEAARYGGAIRKLREERALKQSDVPGLSERQVRRLEDGDTVPHAGTLKKLAAAHGMSVEGYMKELAKRSRARSKATRGR